MPVMAGEGAHICDRCARRLKATITAAPDLCAHLRSLVDPLKATVYDSDGGTGARSPFPPSPVNVDLIDAGTFVVSTLAWWANYFGDPSVYRREFLSAKTPEEAYQISKWAADYLLFNFEKVLNDSWVDMFSRRVIDWPEHRGDWTILKALARFPLSEPSYWAKRPCPSCGLRTVRVSTPLHEGAEMVFECRNCQWAPRPDELESWMDYFVGRAP